MQYGREERLQQLGWREIEGVDEDLGRCAAGLVTRTGFERRVAEVCLGKVGAVAAGEVWRFARNRREWQPRVEVCRVVDTVFMDQETVYSPRQSNDRWLLGWKGSRNEYELDLLRQRSVEARRGERIVAAPVGFLKSAEQRLEKDPDLRVQQAVHWVLDKFRELGSVRQTLMGFLEHRLELPVRGESGETFWKRPSYATVYHMLSHPAYGGAYAYGKIERTLHYESGEPRRRTRHKPPEPWLALIPNAHEGYVSWEEFQRIQQAKAGNLRGRGQPGAVQNGPAWWAGLLGCGRCGRKRTVLYTGNKQEVLRYACHRGLLDPGEPRGMALGGAAVDATMGKEVLRVVQPAAVEAAGFASEEEKRKRDEVLDALRRDWEAARYAAPRAQKPYDAADPENRWVAEELERRWNQALPRVAEVEHRIELHTQREGQAVAPTREEFENLAADLEKVWHSPEADARLKKRIVRALVQEIIVDVDREAGEIVLVIPWKGGVHTELRLPRRQRGQNSSQSSKEIVEAVRVLARVCSDDQLASALNRSGLVTGYGNRCTREKVISLRSYNEIPVYGLERREAEGWMNLTEAAELLGVTGRTLRMAVERGELRAEHPLADGPWVFNRRVLESEAAAKFVARLRGSHRTPVIPNSEQRKFGFSTA